MVSGLVVSLSQPGSLSYFFFHHVFWPDFSITANNKETKKYCLLFMSTGGFGAAARVTLCKPSLERKQNKCFLLVKDCTMTAFFFVERSTAITSAVVVCVLIMSQQFVTQ